MITQTSGVDISRREVVSQSKHRDEWRITGFVAIVIVEFTTRQLWTRCRFGCHDADIFAVFDFMPEEGERNSREIGTATETTDDYVGIFARHLHLLLSFEANNRLVQHHMIHHATQRIFAIRRLHRQFNSLRNRRAQTSLIIRMCRQDVSPGTGTHTRRCNHLCSECLHDRTTVRFLMVADFHHIDSQFQTERLGCVGEGCAPLTGTCLSRNIRYAFLLAIISLRQSGVQFVRTDRADTFVLEIDMRWRIQCFFQTVGTDERCRTPNLIHVANFFGNFNPRISRIHFLLGSPFREQRVQVFFFQRLLRLGVKHGHRFVLHIRHDVIPCRWNIFLFQ